MLDRVLDILKSQKIEKYCIYEERRESSEMFFVKKNLDLVRSKNTVDIKLTVYREFDKDGKHCLGSSDVFIYPETDNGNIIRLIKAAYDSALYADNPYFELPEGENANETVKTIPTSLPGNAMVMAKALYEPDKDRDAWINSAEIFAKRDTVRIVNYKGCDVRYVKESVCGEFVVQSRLGGNDVELFKQFEYDGTDAESLTVRCSEALKAVKDRASAVQSPSDVSGYPIILCDETVGEFLQFYLSRCNASCIYPKYSDYKVGGDVCAEAAGDKVSIQIVPDKPYSSEGIRMISHRLIDNGIVKTLHGDSAYSSYIGIEPIGAFSRILCDNEGVDDEELLAEPYIMVKSFSDFQMDAMDGSFGGEFRLAYLCDGGKITPLTGGTVSGNMFDAQKKLAFSKAKYKEAGYYGPSMVRIG